MHLIINARYQVLARYGNALAALGEGQARTALSRALNHQGDTVRGVLLAMRTEGMAHDATTPSGLKCLAKLFGCFAQRDNSRV